MKVTVADFAEHGSWGPDSGAYREPSEEAQRAAYETVFEFRRRLGAGLSARIEAVIVTFFQYMHHADPEPQFKVFWRKPDGDKQEVFVGPDEKSNAKYELLHWDVYQEEQPSLALLITALVRHRMQEALQQMQQNGVSLEQQLAAVDMTS